MSRQHTTHGLQTLNEEIANSISHGVGLLLALAGAALLLVATARTGSTWTIVGDSVFATTMVLLYLASTLYHSLKPNRIKEVFRILDHGAVFLLIAGTYTPFTLGVLRGPWGWTMLGLVWTLAIAGIGMKAFFGARYLWFSVALYVTMGWLVVIAAKPVITHVPLAGLLWILAGGIAYTGGLGFFAAHRLRYSHFIWHLFVVVGTTCHFCAVFWYSA